MMEKIGFMKNGFHLKIFKENKMGDVMLSEYDWMEKEKKTREWIVEKHPESLSSYDECMNRKIKIREEMHEKFPFVVCIEGPDPALSFANRWCWQNIGLPDGVCGEHYQEYPGCPLVLATETIHKRQYKDQKGNIQECEEKTYKNPGNHSHEGVWSGFCLDKVGYDEFALDFCFKTQEDKNKFLEALPNFDIGENY